MIPELAQSCQVIGALGELRLLKVPDGIVSQGPHDEPYVGLASFQSLGKSKSVSSARVGGKMWQQSFSL